MLYILHVINFTYWLAALGVYTSLILNGHPPTDYYTTTLLIQNFNWSWTGHTLKVLVANTIRYKISVYMETSEQKEHARNHLAQISGSREDKSRI